MFELIVSPFLDEYLVLRPGSESGIRLPARLWTELSSTEGGSPCPGWLVDAARRRWPDLDLSDRRLTDVVLVRAPSGHAYGRASYELNLGCNYDCEHCYLGLKRFEGLSWPDRERLLQLLADAGVLWLQLTGGEPLIDKLFTAVYQRAFELGMMLSISSNGSRLAQPDILELLTRYRPYRLTISVYGATAEAYDGLTRRRGSFAKFTRGLAAAHEAGLPLNLNLIVTQHNAHELDAMKGLAERYELPHHVFSNMAGNFSKPSLPRFRPLGSIKAAGRGDVSIATRGERAGLKLHWYLTRSAKPRRSSDGHRRVSLALPHGRSDKPARSASADPQANPHTPEDREVDRRRDERRHPNQHAQTAGEAEDLPKPNRDVSPTTFPMITDTASTTAAESESEPRVGGHRGRQP